MNKKIIIPNLDTSLAQTDLRSGTVMNTTQGNAIGVFKLREFTDPIDVALRGIIQSDIFGEIEKSPVLRELVSKYPKHWNAIVLRRDPKDDVIGYIDSSLISDRTERAGFDPGYIKILLFIQDRYRIYKENSPN